MTSPPLPAVQVVTARSTGEGLAPRARVTLNFHPDRALDGVPILVSLATDGVYRSQFETGTSNGGLTAHPGGDRWLWESSIFGGVYDDGSWVDELSRHPDYRGPELVALGLELARDGYLDARIIGEASATGHHDPQSLKRVWHLVARFGR